MTKVVKGRYLNSESEQTIKVPLYKSQLVIHQGGVFFNFEWPKPNWWWRLWQWILLGWKWKKLPKESVEL